MQDRSYLLTEQRLAQSMDLDAMDLPAAAALMNAQDAAAVVAVNTAIPQIVQVIQMAADALAGDGRVFYVGAGTSGRLGVLDAAECPPTFRTSPDRIVGIMAGGPAAMFAAQEGAEDRPDDGASALAAHNVGPADLVIGIAAGGTTPFVHGALARARQCGARSAFITCIQETAHDPPVDATIRLLVGPEVLTGSTRLKAATATKLALNMITTLAMVRLGKVYQNLMVDLRATNQKLWDRGTRILCTLTGLDRAAALQLLRQADGHVKAALVMHRHQLTLEQARARLEACGGQLRAALEG